MVGTNLTQMVEIIEADPMLSTRDEEAITKMVVNAIYHGAGFLYTGVSLGKRIDIEQYNLIRETVRKLQHVLDNQ